MLKRVEKVRIRSEREPVQDLPSDMKVFCGASDVAAAGTACFGFAAAGKTLDAIVDSMRYLMAMERC